MPLQEFREFLHLFLCDGDELTRVGMLLLHLAPDGDRVAAIDPSCYRAELLLDFVCRPEFPPAKVEKERGIILQELGMYRDSPGSRLSENLLRALFVRHPARIDIGGTPASVRAIRRTDLEACHAAYYAPSNLCLVVVGNTSLGEVLEAAGRKVPGSRRPRPPHRLPAEPATPARRKLSARMDVAQPQFLLGFKDPEPAARGLPLLRRRMAVGMALGMLLDRSAPLYQALYDDGLIDEDFSAGYAGDRGFAYAAMGGKAPHPEALRRRLLEGLSRARREGFPPGALERAKRKSLGGYLCLFDRPQSLAASLASAHFLDIPILDYPRLLRAFRIEEAESALVEVLDEKHHAFSVVWPKRA